AQFDTPVFAPYAEPSSGHAALNDLVAQGVLRRGTTATAEGLYYWLDDTSEAELYLRAASVHGLLGALNETQYALARLVEYLACLPPNYLEVLSSAEAQNGASFISGLLRGASDSLLQLLTVASPGALARALAVLRRADVD